MNFIKGATLASAAILPGFGPISPDRVTGTALEVHWMIAVCALAFVVALLIWWGAQPRHDWRKDATRDRYREIDLLKRELHELYEVRQIADDQRDAGHVTALTDEIDEVRAKITQLRREIREIAVGLAPGRNDW